MKSLINSLNPEPKVVVVTLNYNQNDYTLDCVNSLLKSDYPNLEIVLVDNGSTAENFISLKESLPRDNRLKIYRLSKNLGYVGGINYGMESADKLSADYQLIMNNDTLIAVDAIKELVFTSEKYKGKAIVSGKVYNYDEKDTLQYIGQHFDPDNMLNQVSYIKNLREKDTGQYDREIEMGMSDDIFWMLSKELFKKVGFYSDYFFLYGEQNDYGYRALKKGYKFIYTHKAKLWHKGGATTADGGGKLLKSAKIEYWVTMATLKLSELHLEGRNKKLFRRNFIFRNGLKKIYLFLIGKVKYDIIKSHFLVVKHFKFWKQIRYKDNGYNPFD